MALFSSSTSGRLPDTASLPVDPALAARFGRTSQLCAVCVAVLGSVVLIGWLTGFGALKSIWLDTETVKANTALGLLAAAACLTALIRPSRRARHAAMLAGLFVLLDGVAHLCEYVLGVDLGIDQALFHDAPTVIHPGRMAPNTAIALALFGSAVLLSRRRVGRVWPINPLAIAVLAIGLVALVGDLTGASSLSGVGTATRMSAAAALACVLMGTGLLFAPPMHGSVRLLASSGPGGTLARRLLPVEGAIGISRVLGATPILEGIETEEQWRFAVAKGCALGQGFLLGRPQPAEDLTPRLTPDSQVHT
jgi:hypothetical protein